MFRSMIFICLIYLCLTAPLAAQEEATPESTPEVTSILSTEPLAFIQAELELDPLSIRPLYALSPDGSLLATAGATVDGVTGFNGITIWDTSTGQHRAFLPARNITAMAFNPEGTLLATAGAGGNLLVYDMTVLLELGDIPTVEAFETHVIEDGLVRNFTLVDPTALGLGVTAMAFMPDSSALLMIVYNPEGAAITDLFAWDTTIPTDMAEVQQNTGLLPVVEIMLFEEEIPPFIDVYQLTTAEDGIHLVSFVRGETSIDYTLHTLTLLPNDEGIPFEQTALTTFTHTLRGDIPPTLRLSADESAWMMFFGQRSSLLRLPDGEEIDLPFTEDVYSAALNSDGSLMAVLHLRQEDGRAVIQLLETETFTEIASIESPNSILAGRAQIVFTSDDSKLLIFSASGVEIWGVERD